MTFLFNKNKNFNRKTIGILGGFGPQATLETYRLLIKLANEKELYKNEKFPRVVIHSLPGAEFIKSDKSEQEKDKMIIKTLKLIKKGGADFVIIPCNTLHLKLDMLRRQAKVPIIDMISQVVKTVELKKIKKVGLIATGTSIEMGIYQKKLKKKGIKTLALNRKEVKQLTGIIKRVVIEQENKKDKQQIEKYLKVLIKRGAEGIILGCTEICLLVDRQKFSFPIFDSIEILAKSAVNKL